MSAAPDSTIDLHRLEGLAREQVQQRRLNEAFAQQLAGLDAAALQPFPWLLVYAGRRLCRQQSRFAEARPLIDTALAGFRAAGDAEGECWALVEWLVLRYHDGEYSSGLAMAARLLDQIQQPYLRAEFLFGRFLCLIGLSQIPAALEAGHAALAALDTEPDPWLQRIGRIQMLRNIAAGYYYYGALRRAVAAAEEAFALAANCAESADMLPWCAYELGLALWRKGEFAPAQLRLDEARRLAEHWQHQRLWNWAVAAQAGLLLDQGRIDDAWEYFETARHWGEDDYGPLLIQIRQNRLFEARWGCQTMLQPLPDSPSPARQPDITLLLALINLKEGRLAEAEAQLDYVRAVYEGQGYGYRLLSVQLYSAALALAQGRLAASDAEAALALRHAAEEQIYRFEWTLPDVLTPVLQRAAQRGIERSYLAELTARLLTPPAGIAAGRAQPLALEMEIARRTQVNLLPLQPPLMPDLEIAGASLPAEEVGGDFYGYYPQGANPEQATTRRLGVAVGDISGKGLPAALLLSGTVVALSTIVANYPPPAQVARQMHAALAPYTSRNRLNIALCYGELTQHAQGWSLRVVCAGAVPPLIRRRSGAVEWIEAGGLPLGSIRAEHYHEAQSELLPGDTLLLLSDGLPEAMDAERRLFGFEAVEAALAAAPADANAQALLAHMFQAIQSHAGSAAAHDDMTLVVIRILGGAA